MFIIKMIKSVDEVIERSKNPDDILPDIFKSLLFSFKIYEESKYDDKNLSEYSMLFRLYENKIMNISLGKNIIKDIKKHNIQAMLCYSDNLMNKMVPEPIISTYAQGITEINDDETTFDIMDKIYLIFKENEDYEKFEKYILKGE